MNPSISIAVIAKDEAHIIGNLLSQGKFADEIVVVDSGSTDGTQEICSRAGARVIHRDWMGFALQKQFAMEQCVGDWIISLDADEAIPKELEIEILSAIKNADDTVNAFSMPRLSRYLGRWIRHGGWYPDRKTRIVRKGKGHWRGQGLHERLVVHGKTIPLRHHMTHHVYRNISDQVATINSYSSAHVEEFGKKGAPFLLLGLLHMAGKFLETYVLKLGFMDGLAGLVISVNSSWYIFLKHAKAWEKNE